MKSVHQLSNDIRMSRRMTSVGRRAQFVVEVREDELLTHPFICGQGGGGGEDEQGAVFEGGGADSVARMYTWC